MKTIKLSYLSLAFVGIAFLLNSCSSSQQFAGTYPKNHITGKGYGQSVTQTAPQAPVVASACADDAVAPVAQPATETAPVATVAEKPAKAQKGDRMLNWALKVAAKNQSRMDGLAKGKAFMGIKQKFVASMYNAMIAKYGTNNSAELNASSAAGLERASKPLAIVSFATGIAALVTFYGAFFFGPAAIATGVVALIGIKRGGDGKKWMAITGIVCGAVAMFLWIFLIGFFFAAWF